MFSIGDTKFLSSLSFMSEILSDHLPTRVFIQQTSNLTYYFSNNLQKMSKNLTLSDTPLLCILHPFFIRRTEISKAKLF